ncbi:MAG: helix-turn-helix transcriptional regulator [Alphaproteobacteria bacterium]
MKTTAITIEQFRAARALLDWSRAELAKRAGQHASTVKRVETPDSANVSDEVRAKLKTTLEAAGVEFTNGDAPGVRLKKMRGK